VPGKPAPQGSKRHVGKGILIESSKEVGPWRERVALAAYTAVDRLIAKPNPAYVVIEFILPRPASTPKRFTPSATKRPDRDKLERAILDALTGIAFEDDSQVVASLSIKRLAEIGESPGAHIEIYP
jgi:crossover junction endodeoxyribonuclease RusA